MIYANSYAAMNVAYEAKGIAARLAPKGAQQVSNVIEIRRMAGKPI